MNPENFQVQFGMDNGDGYLKCRECDWEILIDWFDSGCVDDDLGSLLTAAEDHWDYAHETGVTGEDKDPGVSEPIVYYEDGKHRSGCECGWFVRHPDKDRVREIARNHESSCQVHLDEVAEAGKAWKEPQVVSELASAVKKHREVVSSRPDVPHYTSGSVEPIDYIFAQGWGEGFCRGNVIKYVTRAGQKTGQDKVGDLEKAQTYIQFLIDRVEVEKDPGEARCNFCNESDGELEYDSGVGWFHVLCRP